MTKTRMIGRLLFLLFVFSVLASVAILVWVPPVSRSPYLQALVTFVGPSVGLLFAQLLSEFTRNAAAAKLSADEAQRLGEAASIKIDNVQKVVNGNLERERQARMKAESEARSAEARVAELEREKIQEKLDDANERLKALEGRGKTA